MWVFEVRVQRCLHPQTGQRHLETINNQVRHNTYAGGFQPIKIPGVTVFDNPFPEWLQGIFVTAGLRYRDINHTYTAFFNHREDAQSWERWVVGGTAYGQAVDGLKQYYGTYPIWNDIGTRVSECDPGTEGLLEDF